MPSLGLPEHCLAMSNANAFGRLDEVGALSDLHQVLPLLAWVLGQVLTCSEVAGPETHHL